MNLPPHDDDLPTIQNTFPLDETMLDPYENLPDLFHNNIEKSIHDYNKQQPQSPPEFLHKNFDRQTSPDQTFNDSSAPDFQQFFSHEPIFQSSAQFEQQTSPGQTFSEEQYFSSHEPILHQNLSPQETSNQFHDEAPIQHHPFQQNNDDPSRLVPITIVPIYYFIPIYITPQTPIQ